MRDSVPRALSDPSANQLLRRLPAAELRQLLPRLERIELEPGAVLLTSNGAVDGALFIQAGVVSMLASLRDGARMEVGLVGPEGMVGLPLLFGTSTSPLEAMVQGAGVAWKLPAEAFRAAVTGLPSLLGLLLRYVDAFHTQVSQCAACNGCHRIEQRLARWTLMTDDRTVGDGFLMTQGFMSHMLGVRRPGINLALGVLQRAGLVQHRDGIMRVLDRPGLEAASCECYAVIRDRQAWLTAFSDR